MTTNVTLPHVLDEASMNVTAGTVTEQQQEAWPSLTQLYEQHAPVGFYVDRVISPLFYIIGIPCNPLCAFIWLGRHTRRSNSSAIYLGALSISHTVLLVLHVFIELGYAWGVKTFDGYVSCELFYTAYICPQYLAPLLVLGFTVERYIAVCHPFIKEQYCTVRRAVIVVLALLAFCFLLSCVQAYLWSFDEFFQRCNHRQSVRATNFPRLWNWVTELVVFGVAPLAALVVNVLVLREIRSITSRGPACLQGGAGGPGQNQASTVTLLCVSFYLICTWLPATLVYSLEREFPMGEGFPSPDSVAWRRHFTFYTVRKCVEEVTLSNSACYFFIYYLTGKHFRMSVRSMMCPAGRCSQPNETNGGVKGRAGEGGGGGGGGGAHRLYLAVPCKSDNGTKTSITSV